LNPYQPGQRVILPDGNIGLILKELPIGEYEILAKRPNGMLYAEFRYPEELKPYPEEETDES
jgi:hypothetical protein